MRRQAARQLLREYTPQVARLFGVSPSNVQLQVQKGLGSSRGDGRVAEGLNGLVTLDRRFLRTADRRDLRGALIHEATHAMNIGLGKRQETFADYARYMLNPRETAGWDPSKEVLAMARRRDDNVANEGVRGNGPRDGRRRRNTQSNQLSKRAPLLGPGQTFGFAAQAAGIQDAYTQAIAAIRAQGGSIRGQYKSDLSDIRANRIAGAAETEGAAIERGIVGSSADLSGRAAVVAEAAAQKIDARGARNSALGQLRLQEMQAQTTMQSSLVQLQAEKRAAQAELANQRFMEDMFSASQQDYQSMYQSILKRLLSRGANPPQADPRGGAQPTRYGANGLPLDYYTDSTVGAPATGGLDWRRR